MLCLLLHLLFFLVSPCQAEQKSSSAEVFGGRKLQLATSEKVTKHCSSVLPVILELTDNNVLFVFSFKISRMDVPIHYTITTNSSDTIKAIRLGSVWLFTKADFRAHHCKCSYRSPCVKQN